MVFMCCHIVPYLYLLGLAASLETIFRLGCLFDPLNSLLKFASAMISHLCILLSCYLVLSAYQFTISTLVFNLQPHKKRLYLLFLRIQEPN